MRVVVRVGAAWHGRLVCCSSDHLVDLWPSFLPLLVVIPLTRPGPHLLCILPAFSPRSPSCSLLDYCIIPFHVAIAAPGCRRPSVYMSKKGIRSLPPVSGPRERCTRYMTRSRDAVQMWSYSGSWDMRKPLLSLPAAKPTAREDSILPSFPWPHKQRRPAARPPRRPRPLSSPARERASVVGRVPARVLQEGAEHFRAGLWTPGGGDVRPCESVSRRVQSHKVRVTAL